MYRTEEEKAVLLRNLHRIEGQIRGIEKMLEDGRYCIDILIQVQAARAALTQVGLTILESHAKGCVVNAIQQGRPEIIDELLEAVKKFTR